MRSVRVLLVLAVAAAALSIMGPAVAAGSAEKPPPEVQGKVIHNSPNTPSQGPEVLPLLTPRERGATAALPFTGADLTLFVVAGAAAVGAGALIVRRTRSTNSV